MTEHSFCQAEAKIYAFRKNAEGTVISFVIHPSEVPDELQVAPIGTRVILAVAEIVDEVQTAENKIQRPESLDQNLSEVVGASTNQNLSNQGE